MHSAGRSPGHRAVTEATVNPNTNKQTHTHSSVLREDDVGRAVAPTDWGPPVGRGALEEQKPRARASHVAPHAAWLLPAWAPQSHPGLLAGARGRGPGALTGGRGRVRSFSEPEEAAGSLAEPPTWGGEPPGPGPGGKPQRPSSWLTGETEDQRGTMCPGHAPGPGLPGCLSGVSGESLEGSSERPLQAAAVLWPGPGSGQPGLQEAGQSVPSLVTHQLCDFRLYQAARLSCCRPTPDPGPGECPATT